MRLEDMNQEFPKMPEDMRAMVEREVAKQVKTTSTAGYHKNKRMARRTLIAALVAAMTLATTVFAGVAYQMHVKNTGKYAVEIKTEGNENDSADAGENAGENVGAGKAGTEQAIVDIPAVKLEVAYLPDGMVETEAGKYSYESNPYQGGVSICFYAMDTGDDQFEMLEQGVVASEDIKINGYSGVYLEYQKLRDDEISFNQRIYVAYTDVHYVMEMFVGSDMTKEEALKVAESVKLTPVADESVESDVINDYTWSTYLANMQESGKEGAAEFSETSVAKSELSNTHQIGDCFAVHTFANDVDRNITVMVADVQICDDISLLDTTKLDSDQVEELSLATDKNGNLLPTELSYVKWGDGVNTLSEIVKTEEVGQKLVYATIEYTNPNDFELNNVLFMGGLVKVKEDGDQICMYFGETGDSWDEVQYSGPAMHQEMWYYDVHGGERGNNYIAHIGAGETVTVHMAWVVPEEELQYCYLNLDPYSGCYEFSDSALVAGYVDVRCKD